MFPLVSLCCGALAFVSKRNIMLSLKFIMFSIFWFMLSVVGFLGAILILWYFFLTLAACEGALGLALLVLIIRSHSNDNFNWFSILGFWNSFSWLYW